MKTEQLDREQLINEIWANKGKIGLVAERMGVSSMTIYNYANKYATVKAAIDNSRLHFDELLVDTAEMKLQRAVLDGASWSVKYTLDTKGKNRGYVKQNEVKHSGQVDVRNLSDDELLTIIEGEGGG